MKKLLILCVAMVAVVAMVACEKDNNGKLDPNAMISLRPAQGVKAAAENNEHLTARQIVEQTLCVEFIHPIDKTPSERGFEANQRDFVNNRLLMFGTDIITMEGEYLPEFIEATEVVLSRWLADKQKRDTIAYIPQSVLTVAQKTIKAAFAAGDYTSCYAAFDKAFTFIPVTAEQWYVLKAQGKN